MFCIKDVRHEPWEPFRAATGYRRQMFLDMILHVWGAFLFSAFLTEIHWFGNPLIFSLQSLETQINDLLPYCETWCILQFLILICASVPINSFLSLPHFMTCKRAFTRVQEKLLLTATIFSGLQDDPKFRILRVGKKYVTNMNTVLFHLKHQPYPMYEAHTLQCRCAQSAIHGVPKLYHWMQNKNFPYDKCLYAFCIRVIFEWLSLS